jgi:hypothetical protein
MIREKNQERNFKKNSIHFIITFFLLHNFDGQRLEVFIYRYTFSSFFKEDLFFYFTYIFFHMDTSNFCHSASSLMVEKF